MRYSGHRLELNLHGQVCRTWVYFQKKSYSRLFPSHENGGRADPVTAGCRSLVEKSDLASRPSYASSQVMSFPNANITKCQSPHLGQTDYTGSLKAGSSSSMCRFGHMSGTRRTLSKYSLTWTECLPYLTHDSKRYWSRCDSHPAAPGQTPTGAALLTVLPCPVASPSPWHHQLPAKTKREGLPCLALLP